MLVAVITAKIIWRQSRPCSWKLIERRVRRLAPAVDSIFTVKQDRLDLLLIDLTGEHCYIRVNKATPADAFRLMNLGRRLTTLYRRNLKVLERYPHFKLVRDNPLRVDLGSCHRSLLSLSFRLNLISDNNAYQRAERKRRRRERKEAEEAAAIRQFHLQQERAIAAAAATAEALAQAIAAATSPVNPDAPAGALSRLPAYLMMPLKRVSAPPSAPFGGAFL